jgi:hypothetical protein
MKEVLLNLFALASPAIPRIERVAQAQPLLRLRTVSEAA